MSINLEHLRAVPTSLNEFLGARKLKFCRRFTESAIFRKAVQQILRQMVDQKSRY